MVRLVLKRPSAAKRPVAGVGRRHPAFRGPSPLEACPPYELVPLAEPRLVDGFWVEFDICFKLAARTAAEQGRTHGKPLKMRVDSGHGSESLGVTLALGSGHRWHTKYHRIVALSLLSCYWDSRGALLAKPYKVPPERHGSFEIHHRDNAVRNGRLVNLAVLPRVLHRRLHEQKMHLRQPSCGWGV